MIFTLREYQVEFGSCSLGIARELPELHTHIRDFRNDKDGTSVHSFQALVVVIELAEISHGIKALLTKNGSLPEDFLLHKCDLILRDLQDRTRCAVFHGARMTGYEQDFRRVLFCFPGALSEKD